mgnify:CR=1 FL=1
MLKTKIFLVLFIFLVVFSTTLAFHSTQSFYKAYVRAEAHFKKAEFEKAIPYLNQALKVSPKSAKAAKYLAWSYQKLGRKQEALAALEKAFAINAQNPLILQELADGYYGIDEYAQAEKYYRQILANSFRPQAGKKLAEVLAWQGRHDEAIGYMKKYVRSIPFDLEALELLGDLYFWSGDYAAAVTSYASLKPTLKDNAELIFKMAEALRLSGKHEDASKLYEMYIKAPAGERDRAEYGFAESLGNLGKYDEAVSLLSRVHGRSPDDKGIAFRLAFFLEKASRLSDARAIYIKLLESDNENRVLKLKVADLSFSLADYDIARKYYAELLSYSPQDRHLQLRLADLLFTERNYREAVALYEKAAVTPIEQPQFRNLCYGYVVLERRQDALRGYEEYLKAYPGDVDAKLGLAQLLLVQGKADEAEIYTQELLKEHASDKDVLLKLAVFSSSRRKYTSATRLYERILSLDPENKEARLWLARIKSWSKDYRASLELYGSLIERDAGWDVPRREKARVLGWMREYRKSVLEYQKAVKEIKSTQIIELEMRAKENYYLRFYKEAITAYHQWLALEPDNLEALFDLAQIYAQQRDWNNAIKSYERILTIDPTHFQSRIAIATSRRYQKSTVFRTGTHTFEADSASRQADARYRGFYSAAEFPLTERFSASLRQEAGFYNFSSPSSVTQSRSSFALAYNSRPHFWIDLAYAFNNYSDNIKESASFSERLNFSPAGGIEFALSHERRDLIENGLTLKQRLRSDDYKLLVSISPNRRIKALVDGGYMDLNDGNHKIEYGVGLYSQLLYEPSSLILFYQFRQYGFSKSKDIYFSPASFHINSLGLEWKRFLNAHELFEGSNNTYYTLRYQANFDVHDQHGHVFYAGFYRDWNDRFATNFSWQKIFYEHRDNYRQEQLTLEGRYYF